MNWRLIYRILIIFICTVGSANAKEQVYLPTSPASIPLILALEKIPELEARMYINHSQANALFLRGDASLLLTGLAVGRKLYEQGIPLSIVASHVTGLSYIVSAKSVAPLRSFKDLLHKKIWLPFPGSPVEEVCRYFAKQEGLKLGKDIEVGYTSFTAMTQLLESGKIEYAVLPEPFVTVAEQKAAIKVQLSLVELWNGYNKGNSGYPQVALLAQQNWLSENQSLMEKFIVSLSQSIDFVQKHPQQAVDKTKQFFNLPDNVLIKSLFRTDFKMLYGEELNRVLRDYYHRIDQDLGDDFEAVY